MWIALVAAYAALSRLAYVGWVGRTLWRQDRIQPPEPRDQAERSYQTFRRTASRIMANDSVSLVLLCLVTRETLTVGVSRLITGTLAMVLIVLGIGVKVWAARTLGDAAYYWHNFFVPPEGPPPPATGPYRFMQNPMYTVGYAHAYGFALLMRSLHGLIAAAFFQAAVLAFHYLIEEPHYRALTRRTAD